MVGQKIQFGTFETTGQPEPTIAPPPLPSQLPPTQPTQPSPTPWNFCADNPVNPVADPSCICTAITVLCQNHLEMPGGSRMISDGFCNSHSDGRYCIDKPVVYLYPVQPTEVNVTVTAPGTIARSIPPYPPGGWQVTAYPSGLLSYHGQLLPYLFYETQLEQKPVMPNYGLFLKKNYLGPMLTILLRQYGLNESEQNDFLAYWLPRLNQITAPYIRTTILSQSEKQAIDQLTVIPTPDTTIELIFLFEPSTNPIALAPLPIPVTRPKRTGFTLVEWGGGISLTNNLH